MWCIEAGSGDKTDRLSVASGNEDLFCSTAGSRKLGSRSRGCSEAAWGAVFRMPASGLAPLSASFFLLTAADALAYDVRFLTESSAHGFHSGPRFTALSLLFLLWGCLQGFDLLLSRSGCPHWVPRRSPLGCWRPMEDCPSRVLALHTPNSCGQGSGQ